MPDSRIYEYSHDEPIIANSLPCSVHAHHGAFFDGVIRTCMHTVRAYVRMYCPPRLPWLQVTCAAGWGHPVRVYCAYVYCVYICTYVCTYTHNQRTNFPRKLLWIGLLSNSKDHYVHHSLRILLCGTSLPVSVLWMQVYLAFMSVLASVLKFLFSPPPLSFPVRLFHVQEGYCSKLKRDDLKHTIGLDVHSEEVAKAVPVLSNSVYGHPVLDPLETPDRKYVRVATVNKEFYCSCGANVTSQWTWSTLIHARTCVSHHLWYKLHVYIRIVSDTDCILCTVYTYIYIYISTCTVYIVGKMIFMTFCMRTYDCIIILFYCWNLAVLYLYYPHKYVCTHICIHYNICTLPLLFC